MIFPQPKPIKSPKEPKKKVRKKVANGLSDSNLLTLHRKAVRKIFGYRCFFCNRNEGVREVHHIVKRKNLLLRYDWRNGILLCKYQCHPFAETPEGKHEIDLYITPHRDHLQERSGSSKDWFVKYGITKQEYCESMKKELESILGERTNRL